jgi:hypothetical protein
MKINCISCGFKIDLDDAYSDYEGTVRCYTCETLINVKIEDGMIKSVTFAR